jgi:hypothetical protein
MAISRVAELNARFGELVRVLRGHLDERLGATPAQGARGVDSPQPVPPGGALGLLHSELGCLFDVVAQLETEVIRAQEL